ELQHQLTEIQDLRWSADSQKLAFRARSMHQFYEIFVLQTASMSLSQVSDFMHVQIAPAWSPDAQSLIFSGGLAALPRLYRAWPFSDDTPQLLAADHALTGPLIWWPDGSRIFCVSATDNQTVYALDLATQTLEPWPELSGFEITAHAFSANGQQLVFAAAG